MSCLHSWQLVSFGKWCDTMFITHTTYRFFQYSPAGLAFLFNFRINISGCHNGYYHAAVK